MANFNVAIYGLDEIKNYINPNRVNKALAMGVNKAVLSLHSALQTSVNSYYKVDKPLSSVLIGSSTSSQRQGKGFITNGLAYKDVPVDLSKFVVDYYAGNINPATKQGRVHVVEVIRGRKVVSRGKDGRGGFVPRYGSLANPSRAVLLKNRDLPNRPAGKLMLERRTSARYPLRVLYAPSLAAMAASRFEKDSKVKQVLDSLESTILEDFI